MFLNIESIERKKTAIHDDSGTQLTYGELCDFISEMEALQLPRSIVFCLCENTAATFLALASRLPYLYRTSFGLPVEPEVVISSASLS